MKEITVTNVSDRSGDEQVIDVREDFEVAEGMIPGAIHIPMGQVQERLAEIDRSKPVIAVCRSGNRSSKVTQALEDAGFDVSNMAGGMIAWNEAGLPTS